MTMEKVKVGVIGAGSLGEHHVRLYSQLPGAELVGLYDADPARARAMAEKYGTRAFDTVEALAAEIAAASIVVPTDRHLEVSEILMDRNLHLLVEKPIAVTTAEAERMVTKAQARGLILQVGHVERFNPVLSYLEALPGTPRFIEAHRLAPYPAPRPGLPPRGTEVSVVLDLMIHDLEVILHLVSSPPKEVHAVGVPVLSASEDIANARIAFENGCVANVTASRISPERMRKIRVFSEDSYLSLDYMNQAGEAYRKVDGRIERAEVPVEKGEPLAQELAAFVRCVASHGEPVVSGRQAADALNLAVHILHTIRQARS